MLGPPPAAPTPPADPTPPTNPTPPVPTPPSADTTAPKLELAANKRQRLGRPVKLEASCDEPCTLVVKGTVKPKGSAKEAAKRATPLKLKPARAELAAGEPSELKLKLSKKTARKLADAAKAKAKLTAIVPTPRAAPPSSG